MATPAAGAEQILDRPQTPLDIPLYAIPDSFEDDSYRLLGQRPGEAKASGTATLYAARTLTNLTCLVALGGTAGYLASCTEPARFPASGLRLYWSGTMDIGAPDEEAILQPMEMYAVWHADGTLEYGGSSPATSAP
ncbi:hypothetical protein [Cryobacterium roopkundense]|uniref:Uncharacterized protein n=1 Tax=Cryobacterium roopkundense TaxID=1001240 RepID=A0A7W8ZY86_9MICO|nr:hypothetical protein [Cryobacterium roopkundense]MBB5642346.1 hypothetical protein [Cryobacterium roopkundense]